MVLNRADKKQFEVFRSVNTGSKVEQRPYNHNIPYGGSIKCFSEDEFNVAVANMFTYPAKIAHLEQFDENLNKFLEGENKIITSVKFGNGRVTFNGIKIEKEEEKQDA